MQVISVLCEHKSEHAAGLVEVACYCLSRALILHCLFAWHCYGTACLLGAAAVLLVCLALIQHCLFAWRCYGTVHYCACCTMVVIFVLQAHSLTCPMQCTCKNSCSALCSAVLTRSGQVGAVAVLELLLENEDGEIHTWACRVSFLAVLLLTILDISRSLTQSCLLANLYFHDQIYNPKLWSTGVLLAREGWLSHTNM